MAEVQKGKERELSIEVGFLHRTIDLIESAVIVTNTSGNMLFLNRKARDLFGYSIKGPVNKSIGILFLPDDLVNFLPNILKITRNEGEYRGEILLRKKSGKRIFVKLEASLYQGERGNEGRIVFTIQDIEILKDLERDYLESQRLASLGRMVERISHTIRNPMVSIGGFARRISRNLADEDLIGYFKRIEREINRLEAIIDQVQKFAAVPKPIHRKEDIREAIEASLQSISSEASKKGVEIHLKVADPNWHPMPFIDRELLSRAISSILGNALEAMDDGGEINVRLFPRGDHVGVEISDTGCGIPEENLNAIFEPFFSTKPERVGINLTIAQ